MARTVAELDAAVAELERWRAEDGDPKLARAAEAIAALTARATALEAFAQLARALWRALRLRRRIESEDPAEPGVDLPAAISEEDRRAAAWTARERAKVGRRR